MQAQNRLTVHITPPLVFTDPSAHCPEGGATFGVSTRLGNGSGSVCFLAIRPASFPCHSDVGCQEVESQITFELPQGTIVTRVTQFETFAFDPQTGVFSVLLYISGTVIDATNAFHSLVGADVSGSGRTDVAPDGSATTDLVIVIG